MSYQAKNELVRARQLKTQRLSLPFAITYNATPASVAVVESDPAILGVKTEGINHTTALLASADTTPTFASCVDANGVFAALIVIGEQVTKVVSVLCVGRTNAEVINGTLTATPATGIVAGGALDKICVNFDSGVNFATTSYAGTIIVEYETVK